MKSMSWLLYESESSVVRECQVCGFSTRSPSIYRRHSRHCVVSNSAVQSSQESNGTTPATDFHRISTKLPADFPDDHTELRAGVSFKPPADFPNVSCESSVDLSDISLQPLRLVAEASDKLDPGSNKPVVFNVEERDASQSVGEHGLTVKTSSCKVEQLSSEFLSDSLRSSSSTSAPADSNFELAPAKRESPSPGAVAGVAVLDNVSQTRKIKKTGCNPVDDFSHAGDDMPSLKRISSDAVKNSTDSSGLHIRDMFESYSASTADHRTEEIQDEMKNSNKLVDCSEANSKFETATDLPAVENNATTNECHVDISSESTKIQTALKKSPQSRKRSSPSKQCRCMHCKFLLSSRLERRTHMQTKHPDKIPVFRCSDCNYCSIEHKNYERHLLRHLLSGPFRCNKCTFSSTSQSSIKRHVALQHSDQSKATADNVSSLDIAPKDSEISSTVSEVSPAVSSPVVNSSEAEDSKSEIFSSPSELISGGDLPADSNHFEKLKSPDSHDSVAFIKRSRGSVDEGENVDTEADVSCDTLKETATPDSSKDVIQSMIEVEVKNCPDEEGGKEETWWTCLACCARYNERAKVRRHVKCKHRIPLTMCHVNDLRSIPPTQSTSSSFSPANDLIQKLEEARSSDTTQVCTGVNQLQRKSFVKIAPKPLELDDGQIFAAPATIINTKRQVVLPKCNWKQMSFSLQPANSVPESAVKDSDAATCDSESELKRHLTDSPAGDEELSSPIVQQVARKEMKNDVSFGLSPPVTQEVPKKKRRLILRAKTNKILVERRSVIPSESSDSVKETDSSQTSANILSLEHADNVDIKQQQSNDMEDTTSGETLNKASESSDEQLKKTSQMKRQLGIKRTSPLKCAHCQFTSFRLPDLRRHLLEHTGDKDYECSKCSRSFRNKIGLYLHEQRKHKADLTPLSDTSQTDDRPQTTVDNMSAETQNVDSSADGLKSKKKRIRSKPLGTRLKGRLNEHLTSEAEKLSDNEQSVNETDADEKSQDKKERPTSKRCTETVEMVQSTEMSDHFKIIIRRQSSVGEEILDTIAGVNNGMMCRFCGYMAKIPVQLTQHMKIHTGERDYWCTIGSCTYRTIWRCDMKRHFKKFHPDEVERHGGNYYELLRCSYQPSKLKDKTDSHLCAESSLSTVGILKMSKRQRRRLLKLQKREHSKLAEKVIPVENESQKGASFVVSTSNVASNTTEPLSTADSDAKKDNFTKRSMERFRPYKCSECGRRSNWRWDLKKHIQAVHKTAAIIKLNDDVARATFADIYSSHGGRNGVRFPRRHGLSDVSLSGGCAAESRPNCDKNSQSEESGVDPDGKKSMSELERTLVQAPVPVKSIGMIDKLKLRRFQCSGCPYRSNHRGDLGRHIRMRHGRGNCTISVLGAEVATATLHAYRLQWNRKKAWLPNADSMPLTQSGRMVNVRNLQKFRHRSRSALKEKTDDAVSDVAEESEKTAAESEPVIEASNGKQHYKDFWYLDDGGDETKCCDICPFKTDRTGLLELHKLRHRAPAADTPSGSVTFSCPHCPYFVRTSRQLERHMALHEDAVRAHHEPLLSSGGVQHIFRCCPGKNRYVCEKCPFVSMVRNEFWLHRRLHFVPKVSVPYSCDLCPFWASDRRTLSEHSVLHTQSYYPRLLVPVISCCRPADVKNNDDEVSVMSGHEPDVVAEVVDDLQSNKSSGIDDDMEVESCPQLDAVDQLMYTVGEAELPECCPLLEPECEPLNLEESITCPTLCAETPVLTLSSSRVADLLTSDSGEVLLKDNDRATLYDGEPASDGTESSNLKTEVSNICPPLSAESLIVVLPSGDVVNDVMSEGDDVSLKDISDVSDERMSSSDQTESTDLKCQISDCQLPDAWSTLYDESPTLTPLPSAVGSSVTSDRGDVSLKDNQADVLNERIIPTDCTEGLQLHLRAEVLSCQTPDSSSAGVNYGTKVMQGDFLQKDNTAAADDGRPVTDHTRCTSLMTEVSRYQIVDALRSDGTQALDADGRCADDVLPESNSDASDDGKPATDCTQSGELQVKPESSSRQIPDTSSVGGNNWKVESVAGGSRDDRICTCALQCPYCFFAIASVRLLRQHIMFHTAMADAVQTPVFHPQLDEVVDGRMDDLRCAHLVQLCNRCLRLAELGNPDPVALPKTSDPFPGSENHDSVSSLGNTDQMTISEFGDKTAFLSHLSLYAS